MSLFVRIVVDFCDVGGQRRLDNADGGHGPHQSTSAMIDGAGRRRRHCQRAADTVETAHAAAATATWFRVRCRIQEVVGRPPLAIDFRFTFNGRGGGGDDGGGGGGGGGGGRSDGGG